MAAAVSMKLTGNIPSTDDLVRFWRSKVKVAAGHQGVEGIDVNGGASESI